MARTTVLELGGLALEDLDLEVVCPAGRKVELGAKGSPGCRCGIERSLIDGHSDPSSLLAYCMGDGSPGRPGYTACPSWRAQRDADRRGEGALVGPTEGV